jgi:hypothetical protein
MKHVRGVKRGSTQQSSFGNQPPKTSRLAWPLVQLRTASKSLPLVANPFVDGYPMPRWIAFDQKTSSLLRTCLTQDDRIETFGRGALDYALAKPGAVVTITPSTGDAVAVAIFRPRRQPASAEVQPPRREVMPSSGAIRAGGFLGLSDEAAFEEEAPVEEKKGWWKRFWDE